MVAPALEPRSTATLLSAGRDTIGQISPNCGSTSAAYRVAGNAQTNGERMIRVVQRQRGSRIISAHKGRTRKLLNLNSETMCPPRSPMLRLSTSSHLDVAPVNMVAQKNKLTQAPQRKRRYVS